MRINGARIVLGIAVALVLSACGDGGGGVGGRSGSAAGSYGFDVDAVVKMQEAQLKSKGMTGEELASAMKMARQMTEKMKFNVELKSDGTFQSEIQLFGPKPETAKGTWKQDGSRVTVTTTEENGKPKDPPDTAEGTYAEGRLTMQNKNGPEIALKKK